MDVANDAVEFVDEDDVIILREREPACQTVSPLARRREGTQN